MKKILTYILILMVVSCSPVKRLERLQLHHPELFKTTTQIDTTYLPGPAGDTVMLADTFIKKLIQYDTILLKGDVSVKIWKVHDSIKVEAKCPDIPVITKETVKWMKQPVEHNWVVYAILGSLVIVLLYFIFKIKQQPT